MSTVVKVIVENQKEDHVPAQTGRVQETMTSSPVKERSSQEQTRFMRLPIPQIPLHEHNLVTLYCNSLPNMTRQDFVELAIIEKLHSLGRLTDEEFEARRAEIRSRPPRGQRKGLRQQGT